LLSNVYNQNAYFSGNGVRTSLVAAVLKAFPIQRAYETQDETIGEDVFYINRLSVLRDRTDKISESVESREQFRAEKSEFRRRRTEEVQNSQNELIPEDKSLVMCCTFVK
jgi:hypothetical protein